VTKVALVIIYNHRYDQNIPILERLYGTRFSHIFHVVPFYTGDQPNVIPVYDNSYYFSGYVAQAYRDLIPGNFSHYFFIADDLILNPVVDERNFLQVMGLPSGHCFIPGFHRGGVKSQKFWSNTRRALEWRVRANGVEAVHQLPAAGEAVGRLARHKIKHEPVSFRRVYKTPEHWREWLRLAATNPRRCLHHAIGVMRHQTFPLPYPLVGGYSDIFIVTKDAMAEFAHYCGVFAATRLFVEYAIPTAMALSAKHVAEEPNLKLRGRALWTPEHYKELDRYGHSLRALLEDFPKGWLYVHPVKLSRWLVDLDVTVATGLRGDQILANAGHMNQLRDVRCDGQDICMTSTGQDPYVCLPPVQLNSDGPTWVALDLTVPAPTLVQLYFQAAGTSDFREESSLAWPVRAGRHRLVRRIMQPLNGRFRIDPGTTPGEYRIHGIEFVQ
jgi:hypothetical protein